jgi:hypothetical protein
LRWPIAQLQESRAQATLAALKSRLALNASVRRDGAWKTILAAELVPGDVVKAFPGRGSRRGCETHGRRSPARLIDAHRRIRTHLPSEYMRRNCWYTTRPMETTHPRALEVTLEMINAETQLLFSSDWPHYDFDLPAMIYDLPFLSEQAKRNILGLNAARIFHLDAMPRKKP